MELSSAEEEDAPLALLGVRGYACEVFDEPATAWALHQETHLIPWRGDASGLRVDRFDARNLLEDRAQFRQLKKKKKEEETKAAAGKRKLGSDDGAGPDALGDGADAQLASLLHRLRYADYAAEFPDSPPEDASPAENRFPYRYPEDDAASGANSAEDSGGEGDGRDADAFEPTFRVPDGVHVPRTRKRHALVKAAADKARGNAQLEVMMKLRLGGDASFGFLRPASRLHGYYCFLRDQNPIEGARPARGTAGERLLGAEYADSDDEDDRGVGSAGESPRAPSSK